MTATIRQTRSLLSTASALLLVLTELLPSTRCFSIRTPAVVVAQRRTAGFFQQLSAASKQEEEEPDLFEYFDPLLSPHAYPNGIQSGNEKPAEAPPTETSSDDNYDPLRFRQTSSSSSTTDSARKRNGDPFGISIPSPMQTIADDDRPAVDPATTFDPTISPHAYAKGVPDVIVGDEGADYLEETEQRKSVVGVLFMDHGSRNDASNQRLHNLAKLYQQSVAPLGKSTMVVRAAHMEIASPSIQDGIESLVEAGVDEIVCHPYFLSPGRHVKEDIPRLVAEAVEALNVEIPVRTTDPIGSVTDIMLKAVHSLVEETSELYGKNT